MTFYRQKNGVKEAEISMEPTQGPLCPVRAFKSIILRILSYPDENMKSTIKMVRHGTKIMRITSKTKLKHLRNTVDLIGYDKLGFGPDDVGNHSIRSSFVMFLILNRVAPDIVQLQGRRKSRTFLNYIHPQVKEFSNGLNAIMMRGNEFYTVPEVQKDIERMCLQFKPQVKYINENLFAL